MSQQYRQPTNLQARIKLHALYKTNPYDWFLWVYDHMPHIQNARILELGCGTGSLWKTNQSRLPAGWRIHLSDLSKGMVREAALYLEGKDDKFVFIQINAQDLPLPENSMDVVVANHMLYHVPDREKTFAEISRVLKTGGLLLAATNGGKHMQEIFSLGSRLAPDIRIQSKRYFNPEAFSLENGLEQLQKVFRQVSCYLYEDALEVREAEPLVEYILSIIDPDDPNRSPECLAGFTNSIKQELSQNKLIHITKSTGLFVAVKS